MNQMSDAVSEMLFKMHHLGQKFFLKTEKIPEIFWKMNTFSSSVEPSLYHSIPAGYHFLCMFKVYSIILPNTNH
jgi:hypothetical protein